MLRSWAEAGRIDPIEPAHLFFLIWAATQTYADFAVQVGAVLERETLTDQDFEDATETVTRIVLKGCGIA